MRIDIDIQGATELLQQFEASPEIVRSEMKRAVIESQALVEREVKDRTPIGVTGAGGLRGSIASQAPEVRPDYVLGVVGTSISHALPVELGTRPHFPPVKALTGEQESLDDWVHSKLDIRDPAEAESVAFSIARKIAARGTEGAHMFGKTFDSVQAQVQRNFADARDRIARALAGGADG